jgi:hypothetical protein
VRAIIGDDDLVELAQFYSDTSIDVVGASPRSVATRHQAEGASVMATVTKTLAQNLDSC